MIPRSIFPHLHRLHLITLAFHCLFPVERDLRAMLLACHEGLGFRMGPQPLQIQPGVKDIRTALANAIADNQDGFSTQSPSEANYSSENLLLKDRQGLGSNQGTEKTGATTPGSMGSSNPFGQTQGQPLIQRNSRSIRRLMSEKSFTMDTVYSGMIMDGDLPSEPLEVGPFQALKSALVTSRMLSRALSALAVLLAVIHTSCKIAVELSGPLIS